MGYFKDISKTLVRKYPDRKVFVISDHHFYHKNIINLTRSDFLEEDDIKSSLEKMHNHIISKHNEIVGKDDIVIMLGDFSFKASNGKLTELISKLNGHKFLVMGNHEILNKADLYLRAGFEEIFTFPIKFNGDFYSHYPLNASVESGERPDTILYKLLCEEFKNSDSGINFHGHQHTQKNNGPREKNVASELIDYKPIFVGRTKPYLESNDNNIPYLGDEFFDILHEIMTKFNNFQESKIITDYLYTILLELLTPYQEQIVAFGSVLLNKKYDSLFDPSDLDITKLFDPKKSIRTNRSSFKNFGNEIYGKLIQIEGINSDFYKKIDFICILSFIYATKQNRFKGYLDMHILLDEFYKSEDFIKINGCSTLEKYANKIGINNPQTIKFPRYSVQTTNIFADIINCFLQYIYTSDKEKKTLALKKIKKIMENTDITSQIDLEKLQNMLIRFLLRNIYFYESCKRKNESELVLATRKIELPSFVGINKSMGEALQMIVSSKEYSNILQSIQNANNRKNEICNILKAYK